MSAPVARFSLSARDSSLIQADMSWRERSWTAPWYWRSVTGWALAVVAVAMVSSRF
jgi:hypothetical protein